MFTEIYEMLDELLIFAGVGAIMLFSNWNDGLFFLFAGFILMISRGELDLPFISSQRQA